MADDPRWDPEMLAFHRLMEARAAAAPPIAFTLPVDHARGVIESLNLPLAAGGPVMAETRELWLPVRGRRVLCRLHRPNAAAELPVLVYLHGGGWVFNSIDTHDRLMREYAAASGCAVLGPDYTLSPEAAFPQALEECAGVVRAATAGAIAGLDTSRVVVGGDSAGGNLALGAALLLRETDPALRLRGLLLNYGVFDADLATPSYAAFAEGYWLTREKMRFYWDCYCPRAADRLNPLAAPLRADLAGLPPVLLHVAELDPLASENHAMAERLRAAGVTVEETLFPGTAHGFLRALAHVGAARRAVAAAGIWLGQALA